MNYELAKQLKDAGFPQKDICGHCGTKFHTDTFPTLFELIEACGDRFQRLSRMDYGFRAVGMKDSVIFCDNNTPEEAVAKLWLELNKKTA